MQRFYIPGRVRVITERLPKLAYRLRKHIGRNDRPAPDLVQNLVVREQVWGMLDQYFAQSKSLPAQRNGALRALQAPDLRIELKLSELISHLKTMA
jgi:hypothetical protein